MAKATITILCPSGHRRKAQMTPNGNLLQILEDICHQETLDSSEWGIMHQRRKCDLSIPWRLSSIPTNALLEMYKLDERRPTSDVTVQLQLPDNSRYTGSFNPSLTLQQMLDWYRQQSESMVTAFDNSMENDNKLYPVCSYMSEEIIGEYALLNTALRELGLTSGAAVIRYNHRSMTDDELKKVNVRIDDKLARRRPPPSRPQQSEQQPEKTPPAPTTMANPSYPLISSTVPSFNNEEYSIFSDRPVARPTTTSQQQPKTLAETLGINISFDHHPLSQQRQQQPQNDFSNFKFPEATKGQNLSETESSDKTHRTRGSKPSDRHTMAYDLTRIASTSTNRTEELPDSFFELTPEDLRSVLNSLRQQSAEDNPLETRSMRERTQSARTAAYEHIAIRFVVNSSHVLQGLFYPEETVASLMEFVRANLVCPQLEQSDFYLYTSPPRVVLTDSKKSLSAYDLIPAAYVYLGHRKVSPLVVQLATNVPLGTIDQANQIVTQHVFNRTRSMTDDEKTANSDQPTNMETNTVNRAAKRQPPASNMDDKHLRDKLSKFLPGKK